jgi:ubiquinone/menaquinone biosynthesis C-methylase UbiE
MDPNKSQAIAHWDEMGRTRAWSALYTNQLDSRNVHVVYRKIRTLSLLQSEKPGSLLDIGCGPGILVKEVVDRGFSYTGIDMAGHMLEEATQTWAGTPKVEFKAGDAENLPMPDGSVNAITCLGLIEYLPNLDSAIREMRRVLAPGGVAIVSNHNRLHLDAFVIGALTPIRKLLLPLVHRVKTSKPDTLKRLLLQPSEVDKAMEHAGFRLEGFSYYHFTPVPYPFTVLAPRLSHRVNSTFENLHGVRAAGLIAHGYIGKYRKS